MILFHGSNVVVRIPMLIPQRRHLDFGPGFYLTSSFLQAKRWADKKAAQRECGEGIVSVFSISDGDLQKLKRINFLVPNGQWLDVVAFFRTFRTQNPLHEEYDIISGPVADDTTNRCLSDYLDGYLTRIETLRRLEPLKLRDQFAFKTQNALNFLHFEESRK
jgi:hypothetical protein